MRYRWESLTRPIRLRTTPWRMNSKKICIDSSANTDVDRSSGVDVEFGVVISNDDELIESPIMNLLVAKKKF